MIESRHKIGQKVVVNFYECGKLFFGTIAGVKYTDYGKVLYDISLFPFKSEEQNKDLKYTLQNIDSYFVEMVQEKHNQN